MALLWLKSVPWATILANAPGLVEGAKKLAAAMRNNPGPAIDTIPEGDLGQRLHALEQQQQAAAELLRSLAEQNEEMVAALAGLRARAKWQLRIALSALIAACAALLWTVFH